MKHTLLLLLLGCYTVLVQAQDKSGKEPYMTKPLSNDAIKNVEVQTSGGGISVAGVSASSARIEVYIQSNRGNENLSKEEIQRRLDADYNLDISMASNKLTAIAKPKEKNMDWKKALNISFKVFVPQAVSTNLSTSGGSISLENLSGSQDFSTSGGSLNIANVTGKVKGRTSGGNIQVSDSKDDIDLNTSGGSIDASNCIGNIKLHTSGGSLQIAGLKGKVEAQTSGGSVGGRNIEGELAAHTSGGNVKLSDLSCSLETSTSGGHIDVAIKDLGKYVTISNSGGNIDLQLPRSKGVDLKLHGGKIKTDTLNNFSGSVDEDEIEGKLNGGGMPVTVRAGSGRINLSLK
ncbi:MAG: DUF4097 domain-containing protein [Bacteroidota bacterium]|nr:DUF4097 domain-containing protein [Bacteroidota bacterium]